MRMKKVFENSRVTMEIIVYKLIGPNVFRGLYPSKGKYLAVKMILRCCFRIARYPHVNHHWAYFQLCLLGSVTCQRRYDLFALGSFLFAHCAVQQKPI